jgi:hypothetical protein
LIMKREPSGPGPMDSDNTSIIEAGDHNLSTAGTTKRHRHSPSVGATAVHTVVEENEEEEEEEEEEGEEEEEPVKEENDGGSDPETIIETPETSDEEAQEPEQPLQEEAELTNGTESGAHPDARASTEAGAETETRTLSEQDPTESNEGDNAEIEASGAEEGGTAATSEDPAVPKKENKEGAEVNPDAEEEETEAPAQPEKANADEGLATAASDKDKAAADE